MSSTVVTTKKSKATVSTCFRVPINFNYKYGRNQANPKPFKKIRKYATNCSAGTKLMTVVLAIPHVCTNNIVPLLELPPWRGGEAFVLKSWGVQFHDKQVSGDEPD